MKKLIRIMAVVLLLCTCGCVLAGCKGGKSPDNKERDKILSNPEKYPQLTVDEFLEIIKDKTQLSADDLPADKACYTAKKINLTRYIVDGRFLFSCYIHRSNPERNIYTLEYFKDGGVLDEADAFENFAEFIEKHPN